MHEVTIAHAIINIASKAASAGHSGNITAVGVQIGELSGIETDALDFAFSVCKDGTPLQHAELQIMMTEGRGQCLECTSAFPLHAYAALCPQCNSNAITILAGKEMKVLHITVDD